MSDWRIAIIQLCLPHYRVPFFQALTSSQHNSVCVVAGEHHFRPSPQSVGNTEGINRIPVSNYFVANQLAFQRLPGFVSVCPVCIMELNPRIVTNLLLLRKRHQRRLPTILWGHGLSPRPNSPRWVEKVRLQMAHQADALIFYSNKGRDDFLRLGVSKDKLFVAHNSIDVDEIRAQAQKVQAVRTDILFIGRLIPGKKVDLLIHGYSRAQRNLPKGTRLIIIGDGPQRSQLESLVSELGITEKVDFVGEKTQEAELASYFARSAVSVSPGCIGLSAVHSLAYGVPLLIADKEPHGPEIEAFEAGKNGEYFTANSADALGEQLVKMLSHPERLASMGTYGQEGVFRNLSVQRMVEVFRSAVNYVQSDPSHRMRVA
jgi:glycosyltransferase involved in cell wall biosynthesis